MKTCWVVSLLAGLVVCAGSASSQIQGYGLAETSGDANDSAVTPTDDASGSQEQIDDLIRAMELRDRVAQLMLVTFQGAPKPDSNDRDLLKRYLPGGVVIPSVVRPETAAEYVVSLRQEAARSRHRIPLFIGTNLYRLPIDRLRESEYFCPLPSPMAVAAASDRTATERLAKLLADQLATMGFNLHLGPSLELAPTVPGMKGSIYCFGSDPRFAADSGRIFIETFAESGVTAMPMGFPGGGMNRPSRGPAVLLTPRALLTKRDVVPFAHAIETGADIIHVGTTLVPTISPDGGPACLSAEVMIGLLREELGFDGVIVAGPMDASDIAVKYDPSDAALAALHAGADMVYWTQAGQRVMKTVDEISEAVTQGALSQDAIDTAFGRVLALKTKLDIGARETPDPAAADRLLKRQSYPEAAYMVERKSITLVVNRDNTLPLDKRKSMPIGVTGVTGVEELHDALEHYIQPIAQQPIASARHGGEIYDFEVDRVTSNIGGGGTVVCVLAPDLVADGALRLVRRLRSKGMRVVVVLIGYPQTLPDLAEADAVVLAYCDPVACSQSMRAVADVLAGQAPIGLMLPVRDVTAQVGRAERYNAIEVIRSPSGRLPVSLDFPFLSGLSVPYNPRPAIKKIRWDFGDRSHAKEVVVEKAFDKPGRYPITLSVTDRKREVTSCTFYADVK